MKAIYVEVSLPDDCPNEQEMTHTKFTVELSEKVNGNWLQTHIQAAMNAYEAGCEIAYNGKVTTGRG